MSSNKLAIGYWANWLNVSWYDANYPQNPNMCDAGCVEPVTFISMATDYSTINYSFALISQNWYSGYDPNGGCAKYNVCGGGGGCPNCEASNTWPAQDGSMALYFMPFCRGPPAYSPFIDNASTSQANPTPAILVARELGRLSHQHPTSPKGYNITIGGWSDCPTLNKDYVQNLADLVKQVVLLTFADGIDLDIEHNTQLTQYSSEGPYRSDSDRDAQLEAFALFVIALRNSLDSITADVWLDNINDADTWLDSVQNQTSVDYYNSNKTYLADLKRLVSISAPTFTISYTGRFNVFLDSTSLGFPAPFKTDGEGSYMMKNFPGFVESISMVNLMIYDVTFPDITPDTYAEVYSKIIQQTMASGIPANKIVCGIEPGIQAGSPEAPDQTPSVPAIIALCSKYGTLGVMFWAMNTTNEGQPLPQSVIEAIGNMGARDKYNNGDFTKTNSNGWISMITAQNSIMRSIKIHHHNHFLKLILKLFVIAMICLILWKTFGRGKMLSLFIFCGISIFVLCSLIHI